MTNITYGPEFAVTRDFTNSIQADMDFQHCLSPKCFISQIITSCMVLLHGPWFTLVHTEIGGGASYEFLNRGNFGAPLPHPLLHVYSNSVVTPPVLLLI